MKSRQPHVEVVLTDFPDPYGCRESIWIPFLRESIKLDQNTVLVGHSSGAACAMRLLEQQDDYKYKLKGAVLVATAYTDLGDESERRSGYFNRPWDWDKMKLGAEKICIFHGVDDPLIPVREARYIADKLASENVQYNEMSGVSHFFEPCEELLKVVETMIGDTSNKNKNK